MKTFSLANSLRFVLCLYFSLMAHQACAWWNDAWPYRMPISLDTSASSGAGVSGEYPESTILLKLHSGNFEDFFLVKEDLSDVRFIADDDKTPLKFHVEYFDLLNQLAYIWVQVPNVKGDISTGRIWMYYGNEEVTASNADSGASYDVDTAAVFHFSDAAETPQDATAYQHHSSSFGGAVEKTAVIASGARFASGTNMIINDAPSLAISAAQGMTVSLWVKPAGMQGDSWLMHRKSGSDEFILGINQNSLYVTLNLAGQSYAIAPVAALTPDNWQQVSVVLAPQLMSLYVDGRKIGEQAISLTDFSGTVAVGASLDGKNGFNGDIDELRIDKVARSEGWIKLQLASQALGGRLVAAQPGEQLGSGGDEKGFFAVIFASTDEIGWTVVGLLGVMAAISFMVMLGKAIYLARLKKDNERFLEAYREMGQGDPGMLDHEDSEQDKSLENMPVAQALFGDHDHYQSSPIYRVYHRAITEIHARLKSENSQYLAPSSVSAIKAALQAQMIRESQRMNSQMVLLTIAISGGPFLGLLGTVMGVMITFAAIAASGDVNIAAIAPGVAAALLTTVAGLVVAIPALFGYNWLMTRIKEATADMRVFTEEFITRVAEYYGEK